MISKDLGAVSAYGMALDGGLDPEISKQEYAELLASYGTVAQEAADSAGRAAQAANAAGQLYGQTATARDAAISAKEDAESAQAAAAQAANVAGRYEAQAETAKTDAESARDTAVDAVDGFAAGAQQALDSVNEAGANWKSLAEKQAGNSEAWAVGQRGGVDVPTTDPAYHNNAKYYAEQAGSEKTAAQTARQGAETAATNAGQSATAAAESASQAAESARTLTIDATLTQSGQAAGAKETGDKITGLKEDLSDANDALIFNAECLSDSAVDNFYAARWRNGYIREDGTVGNATNICITKSYLRFNRAYVIKVTIQSGYKVRVYEYTAETDTTYVKNFGAYATGSLTLIVDPSRYYIITMMKTDESKYTPENITGNAITIEHFDLITTEDIVCSDFYGTNLYDYISIGQAGITKKNLVNLSDIVLTVPVFIKTNRYDRFKFVVGQNIDKVTIQQYDSSFGVLSPVSKTASEDFMLFTQRASGYLALEFSNTNNAEISPDDFDAQFIITPVKKTRISIPMEKNYLETSSHRYGGPVSNVPLHITNKYPIITAGASAITFLNAQSSATKMIVFYRDSTGADVATSSQVTVSTAPDNPIAIPSGTYYIDVRIPYTGLYDLKAELINANDNNIVENHKRIYINSNNSTVNYFAVDWENDLYSAMCFMMPINYDADGQKVPLILWFDGNTGYPLMGSTFQSNKLPGLQYLRDEGYAVVQIYSWGSYYASKYSACGRDQPYPVPTALKCLKAGLDYIIDRYNVDPDDVHIASKSMGGLISLYFASRPIYPFKSIGMFAPILDMFGLRGRYPDARRAIFEDLDFTGDIEEFADINFNGETETGVDNYYFSERCCENTWLPNKTKLLQLNSAWTDLIGDTFDNNYLRSVADARAWYANMWDSNIYEHTEYKKIGAIPTKIWGAHNDDNVPYLAMPEIIAQLQNAGVMAELSDRQTGGHSVFDTGNEHLTGTTALGIEFDVPFGWVELMQWIRSNSAKPVGQTTIDETS